MRLTSFIATSAMVALSVSAPKDYSPEQVAACKSCIGNVIVATIPICKDLAGTTGGDLNNPTDQQRACWCGINANKSWANTCAGADLCPPEAIMSNMDFFASHVAKPGTCDKVSTTSAGFQLTASKAVTAGAAMAVVGVLL